MPYVMMICGTPFTLYAKPKYLKSYDVNGNMGRGRIQMTDEITEAKRFETMADVLSTWKQKSTILPLRPDGKPNRPLSAFTVEILKVKV